MTPETRKALHAMLDDALNRQAVIEVTIFPKYADDANQVLGADVVRRDLRTGLGDGDDGVWRRCFEPNKHLGADFPDVAVKVFTRSCDERGDRPTDGGKGQARAVRSFDVV